MISGSFTPEPRHVTAVVDIWNKVCRRIGFPELFPAGVSVGDAHLYQAQIIDELARRIAELEKNQGKVNLPDIGSYDSKYLHG